MTSRAPRGGCRFQPIERWRERAATTKIYGGSRRHQRWPAPGAQVQVILSETAVKETTIVVADDHALFRKGMVRAIATTDGLTVVGEAADGTEALKLIEELEPDVALIDVRMPHLDGGELARRLAERDPPLATRVVLISAAYRGETAKRAPRRGAALVLSKELTRDEICAELLAVGGH
jgi:two-component system, NarL family, nitrate/nitrite response regulator NarL